MTASADLESRIQDATRGALLTLPPDAMPTDPAHLFEQLGTAGVPDVVVLDATSSGADHALGLAARLDQRYPGVPVVLVSDQDHEIGLAAMRAGVRDILHPEADIAETRRVLGRASRAAHLARPALEESTATLTPKGRVIAVVSPKGGVGKTTVATNVAVGLAQAEANSTVLVDLDIQFGDVGSALNLVPEFTLPDAVSDQAARDTMVLKTFLAQHETGLYVVCGSDSPAAADAVGAADVSRLLQMLASEFRYVVVDTAPGLSEHTLTVMDQATDLVLVTSVDVPGVRGLRKELDTLTALGMFPDGRHVVLNFADGRDGLSRNDIEATIGTGVDLMLPRSRNVVTSVNQGIPLLQSGMRDPMTKQLRRLVERFTPVTRQATEPTPGRRGGRHRGGAGGRR